MKAIAPGAPLRQFFLLSDLIRRQPITGKSLHVFSLLLWQILVLYAWNVGFLTRLSSITTILLKEDF